MVGQVGTVGIQAPQGHGEQWDVGGNTVGTGPPHLALQVQVVVEKLPHLLIRVLLQGGTQDRATSGAVPNPRGCPQS